MDFITISANILLVSVLIIRRVALRFQWLSAYAAVSIVESLILYPNESDPNYTFMWYAYMIFNLPFAVAAILESREAGGRREGGGKVAGVVGILLGFYVTVKVVVLSFYSAWFYGTFIPWNHWPDIYWKAKWVAHHCLDVRLFLDPATLLVISWYLWRNHEPSEARGKRVRGKGIA